MFTIDASGAIYAIVEAMLPRGTKDKVLVLSMRASVARPGAHYPSEHIKGKDVHFMFYRPSGYTKMGLYIPHDSDDPSLLKEDHVWQVIADHDSCWRTDGVDHHLNQLYFKMCKEVDPNTAPINLESRIGFESIKCGIRQLLLDNPQDTVHYVRPQDGRGDSNEWTIQFKKAKWC